MIKKGRVEPHRYVNRNDVGNSMRYDIKLAKELGYPRSIIYKLENEPDADKRQMILRTARLGG